MGVDGWMGFVDGWMDGWMGWVCEWVGGGLAGWKDATERA